MPDGESSSPQHSKKDQSWLQRHRAKCDTFAEERAVLAKRGHMLAAWSCMRDTSGEEIERHMRTLARPFVELVLVAAWAIDRDGVAHRNWNHWAARAIAVVAWYLAHNATPTTYQGRQAWRVSGYTMGFYRMLVSIFVMRAGVEERHMPHRSTLGHVSRKRESEAAPRGWLGALVAVGLCEAQQFDADKVKPHERGKPKWNPRTGKWEQWAFNQWFLLVCPFELGATRPRPLEKKKHTKRLRVRSIGESLIHRRQRNAQRRADEEAAQERARIEWEYGERPQFAASEPAPVGASMLDTGRAYLRQLAARGPLLPELQALLDKPPPDG